MAELIRGTGNHSTGVGRRLFMVEAPGGGDHCPLFEGLGRASWRRGCLSRALKDEWEGVGQAGKAI